MSGALDPERVPVVVAAGQCESRDHSLEPLELAVLAASEALDSAPGLRRAIERVTMVNVLARRGGDRPAADAAARLGLGGAGTETTTIGGSTPQLLVERAAGQIAAGELSATLVVGADSVRSGRLRVAGRAVDAGTGGSAGEAGPPDEVYGTYRQDLSDGERAAGLLTPLCVYPLFESVLAKRSGRTPAEQRGEIGRLLALFSEVAAGNPHAWFRERLSAEQIATPSADNRLVAEPYTKRMVAFLGGAQAAALVVTSLAVARRLGLEGGAMFVWAAASAEDVWYPVERPDLGRAAGLELALEAALGAAGTSTDEVSFFDLYSCFPSAVQIAAAAIGLEASDARPLTVTGGLPYFGGPGNNYSTHAIASMLVAMREASEPSIGLVTAVSWYLTKHTVGIYATEPPRSGPFRTARAARAAARLQTRQEALLETALSRVSTAFPLLDRATATVDASTVLYDREGVPTAAPVIATLGDGRRVAAAAADGEASAVAGSFLNGARVRLEPGAGPASAPTYHIETKE